MPQNEKTNKKSRQVIKRRCPKCKQETYNKRIRRSKHIKLLLGWLPLEKYQCTICKLEFHLLRKKEK